MKKDVINVDGIVLEALPNANFRVQIDNGAIILCHLAGKMRMNYIKIIPGDKVAIEMSMYDLTRGRIYKRY